MLHIGVGESDQYWFRQWLVSHMAPSHYLNQCWVILNWTLINKHQWLFLSKYKTLHSRKCIWKYRLRNGEHFVEGGSLENRFYRAESPLLSLVSNTFSGWLFKQILARASKLTSLLNLPPFRCHYLRILPTEIRVFDVVTGTFKGWASATCILSIT